MSDSTPFGFGKLVPGFDFLQGLAKGAAGNIPQLPKLSNWVAPTISVEELEKRVDELKAVQFWLEQNSRALSATIQALEVQKMTLATLKGMNFNMGDVANAFKLKTADTVMGGVHKAGEGIAQAAQMVSGVAARAADLARPEADDGSADSQAAEPPATGKAHTSKAKAAPAASVIDPMQWWGALTQQFQEIAGAAMKDAARQSAMDATRNLATGLAKDALKTATGMAGQMASKGVKSMQAATRAKPAAKTAAKKVASKKAVAKKVAPPKAAAKKSPARKAAARKK
ncbi:MAG: PhaM family polyhydroxyalkanoate granule multifunctional regulatory protein [Giesbergeria sp.]